MVLLSNVTREVLLENYGTSLSKVTREGLLENYGTSLKGDKGSLARELWYFSQR